MNSLASPTFLEKLGNKRNLIGGICLLILLSIFVYIYVFGVNIIFLDEWAFVPMLKKYQAEGLSWELLFKQHNEHRIFFPRLFYIETVPLTHMNSLPYMYFNALMLCVEFTCMYLIAKKQFNFSFSNIPVWLIIIPLFVFNFRQSQNVIWAFQEIFYMILVSVVLSLFFLEMSFRTETKAKKLVFFILAIIFGVIATFSGAPGIIVWVAGVFQIIAKFWKVRTNVKWVLGIIWVSIAALALSIYNKGLHSTLAQDLMYGLHNPFIFIHFFFSLISLTSVHQLSVIALPIGILIFSVSVYALYKTLKNNRVKENSFWVSLFIYSLLFAALTTIGRCPIAFEYSDRARYTIFTCILSISTFVLLYDNYIHSAQEKEKKIFNLIFYSFILLTLELNAVGIAYGVYQKKQSIKMREIVLNYKTKPLGEEIKKMYPWVDSTFVQMVNESAPYVEENHYNVFAEKK
jgi:hypothetical protein